MAKSALNRDGSMLNSFEQMKIDSSGFSSSRLARNPRWIIFFLNVPSSISIFKQKYKQMLYSNLSVKLLTIWFTRISDRTPDKKLKAHIYFSIFQTKPNE